MTNQPITQSREPAPCKVTREARSGGDVILLTPTPDGTGEARGPIVINLEEAISVARRLAHAVEDGGYGGPTAQQN